MIDIDTLRQRVEAAERTVGQYHSRDEEYGQRLITLFGGIEERLLEQRDQLRQRDGQIKALEHQNRELRAMLHALLLAVEDGGKGRVGSAVGELEKRLSALVGDGRIAPRAIPAAEPTPAPETGAAGGMAAQPAAAAAPETTEAEPQPPIEASTLEIEADGDFLADAPGEGVDPLSATDVDLEVGSAGPLETAQALEYGIEEEPDLTMPMDSLDDLAAAGGAAVVDKAVADRSAADEDERPAAPAAQPQEAAGQADDEAKRLELIHELLGESEDPLPPPSPPEAAPRQAAEAQSAAAPAGDPPQGPPQGPPRSGAAAPGDKPDIDDSVQQIIDRVSRLVSDLSEQEDAATRERQVSAA